MDQIEPYRQIVQLQAQIVKISRRNSELRKKCEELEEELSAGAVRQEPARAATRPGPLSQRLLRAGLRFSRALSALGPQRWLQV